MLQEEDIDTIPTLKYSSSSTFSAGSVKEEPLQSATTASLEKGEHENLEVMEDKAEIPALPEKRGSSLSRYLERETQLHSILLPLLILIVCR